MKIVNRGSIESLYVYLIDRTTRRLSLANLIKIISTMEGKLVYVI